ncbi:hypothetical protein OG439_08105 [Amycolatopsis sp. NBC_01307]|uniref:hypothetical protein n=1 Tax=Amycolatopsis sp. NBC_01307 TaxID=2903561 RepID=UPI002E0EEC90|nr:hypothetical protein OG439_08105 [Amycolatopsis sp. NBC_01307]
MEATATAERAQERSAATPPPAEPGCSLRESLLAPLEFTRWAEWAHDTGDPRRLLADYGRGSEAWLRVAASGGDERGALNRMSGTLMELRLAVLEGAGLLERLRNPVVPALRHLGALWLDEGRAALAALVGVPGGRALPTVPVDQAAFAALGHTCRLLRRAGGYTQFAVTAELAVSQYILVAGEWNALTCATPARPATAETTVLDVLARLSEVVVALLTSTGRELDLFEEQLGTWLADYTALLAAVEAAAEILGGLLGSRRVLDAVTGLVAVPAIPGYIQPSRIA